ncbi:MAG: FHA domain-containing protein [Ruminococcus sp.]|nr:FHA domain-containing protein [Ruminococcus sp.]
MENLFWDNGSLLYDIKLSKIDKFAISMIQKNPNLDCVLLTYYSKNKNKVFFTTDEMVTLSHMIESTLESKTILDVFIQICETINMVKINMLDENNLVYDIDYILFDTNTSHMKMAYIPIENASANVNVRNFFKELILELETDDYSLNSMLFKKINRKDFDINQFLDFLKEYQKQFNSSNVEVKVPVEEEKFEEYQKQFNNSNVEDIQTFEGTSINEKTSNYKEPNTIEIEETPTENTSLGTDTSTDSIPTDDNATNSKVVIQEVHLNIDSNKKQNMDSEYSYIEEDSQPLEEVPLDIDTLIEKTTETDSFDEIAVDESIPSLENETPVESMEEIQENNIQEYAIGEDISNDDISNNEDSFNMFEEIDVDETPHTLEDILNSNNFNDNVQQKDVKNDEHHEEERFSINQDDYDQYNNSSNFEYFQEMFKDDESTSEDLSTKDKKWNRKFFSTFPENNYTEDGQLIKDDSNANSMDKNVQNQVNPPKIAKIVRTKDNSAMIINKQYFIIGKSSATDFTISDNKTISRSHATIIHQNNEYFISDNGSSNGTWVNNNKVEKLEKIKLNNRDIITLSSEKETFVFYLE